MIDDDPEAIASLRAAFEEYERALVTGDLDAMAAAFDDDPQLVRFGIADAQRGSDELARWRAAQPPLPPGRRLCDTVVRTWGNDFGVVTTGFTYPGRALVGRQSQTWVRQDGGWRVVSAHVSEIPLESAAGA